MKLIPPTNGPFNITANGRDYSSTAAPITVPDFDANILLANGWKKVSDEGAGLAGGLATLDSSAVLPAAQSPAAVVGALVYKGVWNASTNSPALTSSVGTKGFYYRVSVAGSTNIDGITSWRVGDSIIFNGTDWDKLDGSDLSAVALSGAYADLSGKPSIPVTPGDMVAGTVTLDGSGEAVVPLASLDALSIIFVQTQVYAGTPGFLAVTDRTNGVSFKIASSSATDTSVVAWMKIQLPT